jgi:diguanylate cyclase (GGDEF)-like protein
MRNRIYNTSSFSLVALVAVAVASLVTTFVLANSQINLETKEKGFAAIVAAFLFIFALIYFRRVQTATGAGLRDRVPDESLGEAIKTLDEANEMLGGSITRSDVFKLVANKLRDVTPFEGAELFLPDTKRAGLERAEIDGDPVADPGVGLDKSLAEKSLTSGLVQIDGTTIAMPLKRDDDVFGVVQLSYRSLRNLELLPEVFEAISNRIAPLILNSITLERNRLNALTDATTDLPNERAFHLILENQVAEAQRNRDGRPLSILAVDIKSFDDINQRWGHTSGDRVLNYAAQIIKDCLRQMDFFARSGDDEFLIVLPTATREMSHEIVVRIQTSFFGRKLRLTDDIAVEIELNFGYAAFGPDGDTPRHLLTAARVRKSEAKASGSKKIAFFPQEFVN